MVSTVTVVIALQVQEWVLVPARPDSRLVASDHPSHSERTIESYSPELMSPRSFPWPVTSSWWICAYYNNRRKEKGKAGTHQPDHTTLGVTETQQEAQKRPINQTIHKHTTTTWTQKTKGWGGVVGWALWVPADRAAISVKNFYPVLPSVTGTFDECSVSYFT